MGDKTKSPPHSQSKVGRDIEKYGLEEIGQELADRWTSDENRYSLRELAEFFNKKILESTLDDAGIQILEGELDNTYRLLTDDVSSGVRVQIRQRLKRKGIDVDELKEDFVSYQSIRTYLKKYQRVEYKQEDTDPVESVRERIGRLQGRTQTVSEGELGELREQDHIELGEFNVFVDVNVYCEECGTQFSIEDLLKTWACNCSK